MVSHFYAFSALRVESSNLMVLMALPKPDDNFRHLMAPAGLDALRIAEAQLKADRKIIVCLFECKLMISNYIKVVEVKCIHDVPSGSW